MLLGIVPRMAAQTSVGELRLSVRDTTGRSLAASATLTSQMNQFRRVFAVGRDGSYVARELPFGVYRLNLRADGFADYAAALEIRSPLPLNHMAVMKVAPVQTQVPVTDSPTLLDPVQTSTVFHLGPENLQQAPASSPGRGVVSLVQVQPGWLLEANGVLHPRGAEYDTQFVVDGLPVLDNRSPGFAPALDADDLQSVNIMTAGYPAEFGRKLGGVVEVNTTRAKDPGFHANGTIQGGSFGAVGGFASGVYQQGPNAASFSLTGARTDRYLDPPVEENFSNRGSNVGISAGFEHDFGERDRVQASMRYGRTSFLVPNERTQEEAGQRQDRGIDEVSGQISYQHVFSPNLLASVQARGRDLAADLNSNPQSTPIAPAQDRGFREGYLRVSLAGHHGRHDWKAGADLIAGTLHEAFSYQITDPSFFDPSTPLRFRFSASGHDVEESAFAQDGMKAGNFSLSVGLRFDHYHLLVDESAVSPRLGGAYYFPSAGLVLRASYDRIFQTPASENILLPSSQAARALNPVSAFLPVRPARGNFYEAGLAKSLFDKSTLTVSYFRREIRNFGDDDLLLNTGVSFPIAFQKAAIYGVESKFEIPRWGRVSGALGYSYLLGRAHLPVAGGLFLGDDISQLNSSLAIAITQDQRNTANARILCQVSKRIWGAVAGSYGSGLPVELEGPSDFTTLVQEFGPDVVGKVNFVRGRVRPSATVDASVGYDLWVHDQRSLRLQADVFNLADRLNVINFAGTFSGTAVAPGRTFAIRLRGGF